MYYPSVTLLMGGGKDEKALVSNEKIPQLHASSRLDDLAYR
jgi:hypothetical protein